MCHIPSPGGGTAMERVIRVNKWLKSLIPAYFDQAVLNWIRKTLSTKSDFETGANLNMFLLHEILDSSQSKLLWMRIQDSMNDGRRNFLFSLRLNKINHLSQHMGTSQLNFSLAADGLTLALTFDHSLRTYGSMGNHGCAALLFTYQRRLGLLILKEKMKTHITRQTCLKSPPPPSLLCPPRFYLSDIANFDILPIDRYT